MKNTNDDQKMNDAPVFQSTYQDEVNLGVLWGVVWAQKKLVVSVVLFFSVITAGVSLMLPNEYKSEILLAPVDSSKSASALGGVGKLSSLAGLAGINLGESDERLILAMETAKTRKFIFDFVNKNELFVTLIASSGWDQETDSLIIDPELYDETNSKWVRDVSLPKTTIPNDFEAYEEFLSRLSVQRNDDTGYITMSFEFYSPRLSKSILDDFVHDLNKEIKRQDLDESSKAIAYLEAEIAKTPILEMRALFYSLIEEETKTLMLANIREEYILKTIDPAVIPLEKSKPKRALIVIFFGLFGGIVGIIIAILRVPKP